MTFDMIDLSPPPKDPERGHNYQPDPDVQFGGKTWRRFYCDCCGGKYVTEVFEGGEIPA